MNRLHGFSLLELMCVLAILSILAHVGSMQFLSVSQSGQDKQTLKNEMKRLGEALTQARQLAVISGQASFLCGGVTCDGVWSSGFSLYQTEPVTPNLLEDDRVKKWFRQMAFDKALRVSWRGFPAKKQQIEFHSNGLSSYQNGTFELCLGDWQADLILNQSGRFYLTDPKAIDEGACE
ncbi:type IV minor pilin protein FimT [Marinomonas pontica]|uniref:Type II secretion system protein H n=1 Tax=Marinomonas pontica TaxID=264739 RepID=A0ABN6WRE6_9GAMM|nr:type IV minor pilin protein FimT [Marinomonas pontica]